MLDITLIDPSVLVSAVSAAVRFVGKNSSVPIKGAVLITVAADGLTISAFDTLAFTSVLIPCVTRSTGSICLPAAPFLTAIKGAGGPLTLSESAALRVKIKAPGSAYILNGINASEWPTQPDAEDGQTLTFKAAKLADALTAILPCVAGEDNRYGLNGTLIELTNNGPGAVARFVASDGNRLAWAESDCEGTAKFPLGILPRSAIIALLALLAEAPDATVEIHVGERSIRIVTSGGTMIARWLELEFPDYREVIPSQIKGVTVNMNRVALLRALDRVVPFARDVSVQVNFIVTDDELTITSRMDAGEAAATLPVDADGAPWRYAVNGRYLREALQTIDAETITMAESAVLGPTFVVAIGTPLGIGAARLSVLMPLRMD